HRDHLCVARHRPPAHSVDFVPRLSDGAGLHSVHLGRVRRHEPAHRSGVRLARPEYPLPLMFRLGIAIVGITVAAAVFGPWLTPADPNAQDLALRLAAPSGAHVFGLDELGRDIFSRLLVGARISLLVGLAVVTSASTVGILMGS